MAYTPDPGHEILLGLRWTDDFGPVVVVAPGGIHAEFWANALPPAGALAMFPIDGVTREAIAARLSRLPLSASSRNRSAGSRRRCSIDALVDAVTALQRLGQAHVPHDLREIEINPLAITPRGPMALDVLARIAGDPPEVWPPRPLSKMSPRHRPRTIAVAGVSEKGMNVGRIILRNLLRDGFPTDRIVRRQAWSGRHRRLHVRPGHRVAAGARGPAGARDQRSAGAWRVDRTRRPPGGRECHRDSRRPRGEGRHGRDCREDARQPAGGHGGPRGAAPS